MLGVGLGLTQPRGRGAAFVPTDIADLVGWYDASDTATITESGGAVSQWDNKVDADTPLVQSVAASQPTTGVATLNGLNIIRQAAGDGVNNAGGASLNFFPPGTYSAFVASSGVAATIGGILSSDTGVYVGFFQDGSASTTLYNGVGSPTFRINGSVPADRNALHDALVGPAIMEAINLTYSANFLLHTRYTTSVRNGAKDLGEILFYNRAVTADEASSVVSYLMSKWGI